LACKESPSLVVNELEVQLLQCLAETIHDSAKNDAELMNRVQVILDDSDVNSLREKLRAGGLGDEKIFIALIELCLTIQKEADRKEFISENQKPWGTQVELEINDPGKEECSVSKRGYDLTTVEFLTAIKYQLLAGTWDPRSVTQKRGQRALKLGSKLATNFAVNYFILIPFAPALVLPFMFYRFILCPFFGPKLDRVFVAISQILLQKVMLATHNIIISDYY